MTSKNACWTLQGQHPTQVLWQCPSLMPCGAYYMLAPTALHRQHALRVSYCQSHPLHRIRVQVAALINRRYSTHLSIESSLSPTLPPRYVGQCATASYRLILSEEQIKTPHDQPKLRKGIMHSGCSQWCHPQQQQWHFPHLQPHCRYLAAHPLAPQPQDLKHH